MHGRAHRQLVGAHVALHGTLLCPVTYVAACWQGMVAVPDDRSITCQPYHPHEQTAMAKVLPTWLPGLLPEDFLACACIL